MEVTQTDTDPNTLSGWSGFFMRIRIQKLCQDGPDFSYHKKWQLVVMLTFFYFLCIHNYVLKGWRNFVHD